MGDLINLNKVRKARDKANAKSEAAANRAKFGRTGAQKSGDAARNEKARDALDQKKLDD